MVRIEVKFTIESEEFIRGLTQMPERLIEEITGAVDATAYYLAGLMKDDLQEHDFSGDLSGSIVVDKYDTSTSVFRRIRPNKRASRVADSDLGYKSRSPYYYSVARHSPGHWLHRVSLYGTNTKARQKLRRWVKEKMGVPIPDTYRQHRDQKVDFPPWIDVVPSDTASPYATEPVDDGRVLDHLMNEINQRLGPGRWV